MIFLFIFQEAAFESLNFNHLRIVQPQYVTKTLRKSEVGNNEERCNRTFVVGCNKQKG